MDLGTLTKRRMTREVADLIETSRINEREGEAFRAVQAVFKVIIKALQRGESVRIEGFGIFSIKTRPPLRNQRLHYFYGKNHGYSTFVTLPAKKYVHFKPSKPLRRLINPGENIQ